MDSFIQDLLHSLRGLSRQPGFAIVSVVSLALGIGVNTAIFSVLDALLLRPPALRHLDRCVVVYHSSPASSDQGTSFRAFQQYHGRTDIFADVMAVGGARPLVLVDGARRDQVYAELVTSSFFSLADIRLRHGAPFPRDVDRPAGAPLVAVLSHAFWARRFGSDPSIVGRSVALNGRAFVVTGVTDAGFAGLSAEVSADMWIPLTVWAELVGEPARLTSDEQWVTTIGELKPGVSLEQARAAIAIAARTLDLPTGQQTMVRPARAGLTGSATDAIAIGAAAFGAGLIVLTLACTNVVNLLIARAAARQHEMSVRMALGSGRFRLVRLWVVESLVLSASSAGLGLLIASWLIAGLVAFKPPALIGQPEAPALPFAFHIDVRVVVFAFGLSAVTAILVGLVSGFQGSRPVVTRGMRISRGADCRFAPGLNVRSGIIALQMALSTILLIPCGLFVRSALQVGDATPGFVTDNVLLLPISADQAGVKVHKPPAFEQELAGRVGALPGVEAATVMDPVPLWFGGNFSFYDIAGHGPQRIGHSNIGPRYFSTLRLPLLAGRDFAPSDSSSAPAVAIVNDAMARRFWPEGNAIGQRLRQGGADIVIVGIAKGAKYLSLAEKNRLWLYRPIAQSPTDNPTLSLAVRATGDPARVRDAVEHEVRTLVPSWPGFQFRTLDEGLRLQQRLPRLAATLLGGLGAFGLFLAMLGVYGVLAYVVRQRRHELGIRLALGAPAVRVLALVISQGMVVCLTGAALGIAVALAGTRLLASVLYGVSAADLLTYVTVPLVLIATALVACYLPARHATRISLLEVLRSE